MSVEHEHPRLWDEGDPFIHRNEGTEEEPGTNVPSIGEFNGALKEEFLLPFRVRRASISYGSSRAGDRKSGKAGKNIASSEHLFPPLHRRQSCRLQQAPNE